MLFVHGVGFQEAGETFSGATEALIRAIREAIPAADSPLPDPVIRATASFGDRQAPAAEVRVVANGATQHWVMTEAWWATSFRPPNIGAMLSWLGPETAAARVARRLRWRPSKRPPKRADGFGMRATSYLEGVMLSVVISLTLLIYVVLRTVFTIVPIASLRAATIGGIDRFLTGWAGDMRVLLFDEAQAGMVRRQIAHSAKTLEDFGCSSVVFVAHSGGAVASYMTLTDPTIGLTATKSLITFGAGLNIAWRLLGVDDETPDATARRIGGLLTRRLPNGVRWTDYWATDDPVPAGPMDKRPVSVVGPARDRIGRWRGYRISNFWNLRADHGGYFDNDEEFVFPVLCEIHGVARTQGSPDLFSNAERAKLIRRREQRVSALTMWRQFCTGAAAFAIFGSVAAGVFRWWSDGVFARPVDDVTRQIGELWALVPGSSLLADPVSDVRHLSWWPISLTGFLLVPAVAITVVWRLAPWASEWAYPWRGTWVEPVGRAIGGVLFAALAVVALIAVPGLLGMGLSASPFWSWGPARWLSGDVFGFRGQEVHFFEDLAIHIVLTFALVAVGAAAIWGATSFLRSMSGRPVVLWLAGAVLAAIAAYLLFSVVFALIGNSAFGVFILGWTIVAGAAFLLARLGQWRWRSWDRQERWEARSQLQGTDRKRRLGRGYEAAVFALLGVGVLALSIVVAVRPLTDMFTAAGLGMALTYLSLGVLLGVPLDAVNGRGDIAGEAPTAASVSISNSSRGV